MGGITFFFSAFSVLEIHAQETTDPKKVAQAKVGKKIDFEREIAPILEAHCWDCHGEDQQESGLRLDRRANMLRGGDYGLPAVVPGIPNQSYLLDLVNHLDPELKMPPDEDKIPAKEIAVLTRWIAQGAIWPGQMDVVAATKSSHWSFQPIVRPTIPGDDTFANPIDAFLTQQLSAKGLAYSPTADARSLIRRVSFILTGLPPTPNQIAEFEVSYQRNPGTTYSALVDRLLASPHFGERWAQHWLDVIRWAETNGSESNMYRKNAWIYRDYLIRSFNQDKPYQQFLTEQIAGDTMGQGDAMGFLVSGPHVPVATVGQEPSARRQARADRMDEILQTVATSTLGVTIGCARCHNHKFDPVSISDYYSMSAVFQDIEFGSRFPELAEDHVRQIRGKELYQQISQQRSALRKMGPWEENWTGYRELHFPPVESGAVRITFMWNYARIDELEIFGVENPKQNLALASSGTTAFSPKEISVARNESHKINDGMFGTEAWAGKSPPDTKQKPWVQLTFAKPHVVDRLRLSTNRADFLETDYLLAMNKFNFGPYKVECQGADGKWNVVANTGQLKKLDVKYPTRPKIIQQIQSLIINVSEEGPKSSFVGRLINPSKTFVFNRGSPETPRHEVFAAGLMEISGQLDLPPNSPGKLRRKAFAKWLTGPNHPLTARVAANRLWHHVFGRGIVATPSDFGAAGALPSHPELLDWLASEFKEPTLAPDRKPPSWSMKHLLRLMVLSKAFQQSSQPNEKGLMLDAGSALLWRFPPKRMEAEVIRDSILLSSGVLSSRVGGRSYRIHNVKKRYAQWEVNDNSGPPTWRRMIYQERMRRVDDQMFTAFDFPDCGQIRAKRPVSTTSLQALNLLNSQFVIDQSSRIADRATKMADNDVAQSIDHCFLLLLGRRPDKMERQASRRLADNSDLSMVCRALINSNEFAFLP